MESSIRLNSRLQNTTLIEPSVNNVASDYAIKKWSLLVKGAIKFGAALDKAEDLVQDMILNLLTDESEGNGFDHTKGNKSEFIDVEHFIWGRLKLYSKNKKYRDCGVNSTSSNSIVEIPSCSDFNGDNLDSLNAFQYKYATAGEDDLELSNVDLATSIDNDIIKLCCGPLLLRNLLKDIDYFIDNLDKLDLKGMFSIFKLKETEYADSLRNVMMLYSIKPMYVKELINKYSEMGKVIKEYA